MCEKDFRGGILWWKRQMGSWLWPQRESTRVYKTGQANKQERNPVVTTATKKKVPEYTEKKNRHQCMIQDRTEDRLRCNQRDIGHYHLLTPNVELHTSNPDLKLPSSLDHHPVLNLPSWIPVLTYILLFYPTSILCHAISANHTYQQSRSTPPCPAPSLLLPYGVWGEGGLGF